MRGRLKELREAGHVERVHTIPHHGSYTVGYHSWNVAVLLLGLHPDPSPRLIRSALLHDVAERWTGDLPGDLLWRDEGLREALGAVEERVREKLQVSPFDLGEGEAWWLASCDVLELWLWCWDQIHLGNLHVNPMKRKCETWFTQNDAQVPRKVWAYFNNFQWERTDDIKA